MERLTIAPFQSRKTPGFARWTRGRVIVLLRLTLVIAVSYLLLAQEGQAVRFSATTQWLVLVALASNLPFLWLPRRWVESPRFGAALILLDTLWITAMLSFGARLGVDFYLVYFFILFLAATSESLILLALGAALMCGGYLYSLVVTLGPAAAWSSAHLTRLPFFVAVAALYGFLLARTRSERRAHHQLWGANRDPLTALANRKALEERLTGAISRTLRTGRRLALLVFDLDNFKSINATYGQEVGDRVLVEVAQRLRQRVRQIDSVGRFQQGDFESPSRLGGDEFAVVLTEVTDLVDVATVAKRLCDLIAEPVQVGETVVAVLATVGIAYFPGESEMNHREAGSAVRERLLVQADRALYSAKQDGDTFQFYDPEIDRRIGTQLALGQQLVGVLDRDELFLEYQSQVELGGNTVIGVEALLRWRHPTRGVIPPAEFIPILESTSQIKEVGDWVLRTSCREARRWNRLYPGRISLAVNVSAVQFRDREAVERLVRIIEEEAVSPGLVELEITESVLLRSTPEIKETLARIHDEVGVRLALDDFGRGYSSLEYLRRFPIDKLKIDRGFVSSIVEDEDSAAIVSAILALAKRLRLRVVAEGVETKEQLDMLIAEGCESAQGFYFSRPVVGDELLRVLLTEADERIEAALSGSVAAPG